MVNNLNMQVLSSLYLFALYFSYTCNTSATMFNAFRLIYTYIDLKSILFLNDALVNNFSYPMNTHTILSHIVIHCTV